MNVSLFRLQALTQTDTNTDKLTNRKTDKKTGIETNILNKLLIVRPTERSKEILTFNRSFNSLRDIHIDKGSTCKYPSPCRGDGEDREGESPCHSLRSVVVIRFHYYHTFLAEHKTIKGPFNHGG